MVAFRKSLRLRVLVCSIALFGLSSLKINAQSLQGLNRAYHENSQNLLGQFILKQKFVSKIDLHNDTIMLLSRLVNTLINNYCADTLRNFRPDAPSVPEHEKYVILQPHIKVCFVDTLELHQILNPATKRREEIESKLFPHRNVYHSFLSSNYYEFPDLLDCKKWNYKIILKGKGRFTPLKADTNMVHVVNAFLGWKGVENYNKANFLRKKLKVYQNDETQYIPSLHKRVRLYFFNYALFIDNVVFDRMLTRALVQFSFVNQSLEAFYEKSGDKWVKKSYRIILQL
jgi:hypothetical protein